MTFETYKWLYQRISSPIIFILALFLFYKISSLSEYNYKNIYNFFNNYNNLLIFISLIFLSLFHTAIEVFHSVHDYFSNTKNENIIKFIIYMLYVLIFLIIFLFLLKFIF